MRIASINTFDTSNGPGVRVSVFVSGCTLNCAGCFNKEAQNFKHGEILNSGHIRKISEALLDPDVSGLSILGGDPCEPNNVGDVVIMLRHLRWIMRQFGVSKTIWLWTGRTIEELKDDPSIPRQNLLRMVDVIVDGPFVQALADDKLRYRGSSNQRVLYRDNNWRPSA